MKIRTGFVSNSSSSSFVAYGIQVEMYDEEKSFMTVCLKNYINDLDVEDEKKKEWISDLSSAYASHYDWDFCDFMENLPIFKDFSFSYHDETVMVGIDPSDFEDLTPKQVKKQAKDVIKKVFGDKYSVEYIQESWYDG